jgi:hypothetical protein
MWQIGSGDEDRPYDALMVDHDFVAIGAGWEGEWRPDRYSSDRAIGQFAQKEVDRQLVIVKRGRRRACAIGVFGPYQFVEDLDDIEGWELQHVRRVRWLHTTAKSFDRSVFGIGKFSRCNDPQVHKWVKAVVGKGPLDPPDPAVLRDLPNPGARLPEGELDPKLREVAQRASSWLRHYWGNEPFGCQPTESELIAHITVPLLVALGWPPERVAVGWRFTDVALFSAIARTDSNCRAIVEAKRLEAGLARARDQVDRYAARVGHPVTVVVTDGLRYELAYPDKRTVYANLTRLREPAREFFDALRCPMSR